jgi:hypothetical protein
LRQQSSAILDCLFKGFEASAAAKVQVGIDNVEHQLNSVLMTYLYDIAI